MKKKYTAPRLAVYNLGLGAQPICASLEYGDAETPEVLNTGGPAHTWDSASWTETTDEEED